MRGILPSAAKSRSMMVAVVLGAALASGEAQASAFEPTQSAQDLSSKIVNELTRYCQACWRNARLPADRWDDCTQQVFARLLERVPTERWDTLLKEETDDRKELIRAIDTIKKRTQRSRKFAELNHDVRDRHNQTGSQLQDQREALALASQTVLSPRQQRIVEMTAHGWGVPDIANELKTTPERISDEKYKAIRKLRGHLNVDA